MDSYDAITSVDGIWDEEKVYTWNQLYIATFNKGFDMTYRKGFPQFSDSDTSDESERVNAVSVWTEKMSNPPQKLGNVCGCYGGDLGAWSKRLKVKVSTSQWESLQIMRTPCNGIVYGPRGTATDVNTLLGPYMKKVDGVQFYYITLKGRSFRMIDTPEKDCTMTAGVSIRVCKTCECDLGLVW